MTIEEVRRICAVHHCQAEQYDYMGSQGRSLVKKIRAVHKRSGKQRTLGTVEVILRMSEQDLDTLLLVKFEEDNHVTTRF